VTDELVREDPPDEVQERKPSQMLLNLIQLARTPGEWGRIGNLSTARSASQTVYQLRNGQRKAPDGTWEFRSGPIPETKRFGVWARLKPIESEGADGSDTEADAGRLDSP
jgi:hypothetical protein